MEDYLLNKIWPYNKIEKQEYENVKYTNSEKDDLMWYEFMKNNYGDINDR